MDVLGCMLVTVGRRASEMTRELFEQYGRGLEETVAGMVPADLCASPTEIALFLAFARTQGFGQLAGLDQVLRTKFEGLEQICLADVVHQIFRAIADSER